MTALLLYIFIYLAAALVAVIICKRLGLGSVLGYLFAGVLIGPTFGLVGAETQSIQHVAEFGVVMMLFIVGLELHPSKLWELRYQLVGLGGLQITTTIAVVTIVTVLLGYPWQTGVALGCVFAMSSTAIVLQTLNEKGLESAAGGRAAFSTLLAQDMAVIPIFAILPLLSLDIKGDEATEAVVHAAQGASLIAALPGWQKFLIIAAAISGIIVGGKYISKVILRYIAAIRLREVFTMFTLSLVIGAAVIMNLLGLSAALGAFIAGVVLASSEYRHELESTLDPFKGLLLGVFFITIGANINFHLLAAEPLVIVGLTVGVIFVKFILLMILALCFKLDRGATYLYALSLAQAGEFGFVLLSFEVGNHLISSSMLDTMLLVVTLSMVVTPLLFILYDKVIAPRINRQQASKMVNDSIAIAAAGESVERPIIQIGYGRFGQVIGNFLRSCGYQLTVIDHDPDLVSGFSQYGVKTYYCDGARADLLELAGIEKARLLIIAIDNPEQTIEIVRIAQELNPALPIVVRAHDRLNYYDIYFTGERHIFREVFDSAVAAGSESLQLLGVNEEMADTLAHVYRDLDEASLQDLAHVYDPKLPRFQNKRLIDKSRELNAHTTEVLRGILNGTYKDPNYGLGASLITEDSATHAATKRASMRAEQASLMVQQAAASAAKAFEQLHHDVDEAHANNHDMDAHEVALAAEQVLAQVTTAAQEAIEQLRLEQEETLESLQESTVPAAKSNLVVGKNDESTALVQDELTNKGESTPQADSVPQVDYIAQDSAIEEPSAQEDSATQK